MSYGLPMGRYNSVDGPNGGMTRNEHKLVFSGNGDI